MKFLYPYQILVQNLKHGIRSSYFSLFCIHSFEKFKQENSFILV